MSRIISRAESWETAYQAFQNINFSAFDYNTIKQSMLDYIKLYFPENFNDYIESSELIAVLELFAYLGEILAYRLDVNAHENFLSTAQRKESVLRLAKLISYNPSRNIPARGLVKLTSVTTSEQVFDSLGNNLSNKKINWNDVNNVNWKEQFLIVMNKILTQEFGSISPTERIQVDDVIFELYDVNNNNITNGIFAYSTTVSGQNVSLELVPASLNSMGPYEKRPDNTSSFSLVYGSDGLGDGSDTTGFFMFTKQGSLQKTTTTFDGVTPNQTYDVGVENINDTDVWVNNIDPNTGETLNDGSTPNGISGNWSEVDLAYAQNIVFNNNPNRNKYEIETLALDQIRLIFGDGEFANIPSGTFDIWYRTSLNQDIVIPQTTVVNQASKFTYQDINGNAQTFSFTFSLINSLQNASPSEDIEHIRSVAPAVYYTQDRMVNGKDYNTFMLQDTTILKLKAVNRTYAGDSKYIAWHDPSETYENVKLFGDDLMLYFKQGNSAVTVINVTNVNTIIDNYVEPLLSSTDFFNIFTVRGANPANIRRTFTTAEKNALANELTTVALAPPGQVHLFYSIEDDTWQISSNPTINPPTNTNPLWDALNGIIIVFVQSSSSWTISHRTERLIANSETTRFWNQNNSDIIIDYDSLLPTGDQIILLKANENNNRAAILKNNWAFNVIGQELVDPNLPETGLADIHKLSIMPSDTNNDSLPDYYSTSANAVKLSDVMDPSYVVSIISSQILPNIALYSDIILTGNVDNSFTHDVYYHNILVVSPTATTLVDRVDITSLGANSTVTIKVTDYVYFVRLSTSDDWVRMDNSEENITAYLLNNDPILGLYKREHGRDNLNFAWFHVTPQFHLIDPSSTNLIDIFIISRGYYSAMNQWLFGNTTVEPDLPTPLSLRTDYAYLLDNKMISDTVILHPGKFKILFGEHAIPELQASFKVIKASTTQLTDNQIKIKIINTIKTYFDINKWNFGETFYFTEMAADIHKVLGPDIVSIVLVPTFASNQFGDLFQIFAQEDEVLQPSISVNNIEIIQSLNPIIIRRDI